MKHNVSNRRAVIASQIKEAMAVKGMSRKQLAETVGRRPSDVTRWLSGNHNFTVDLLSEISEAVGVQITGVVEPSTKSVEGYDVSSAEGECLCDSGNSYGNHLSVGPISLPLDCILSLQRKASHRGEDLISYLKGVLLKEAVKPGRKAADFCGIWSDDDFGMSVEEQIEDIRSHRTVHRDVEVL